MSTLLDETTQVEACNDIPMPIVKLNRWTLVTGIVVGLVLQQPLFTTALFAILVPAVLFGQRGSLIFQTGKRLFAKQNATAIKEDRRLMRFNNSIAVILLGLAQIAFLFGATVLGWVFAGMVALAASVALAGFCVGCFLYFQFKLNRYRLFGSN
jgi:hypothetical protein